MKNLVIIFVLLFLASQFVFSQGVFNSNQSGSWNQASTWTLISGSDTDGIPDSDDEVVILNGHTVSLTASANVKNITINNGGTLRGPATGTTIYYLRIFGTSLINNGTLGGLPQGTQLGLEPANSGGTVTITGSGSCVISQLRPYTSTTNLNVIIDLDMLVDRSWSRGLGFTAFRDNYTNNSITINYGKTVTLDSTADFHLGSTGSAPKGGNTTYNINGTLKTNSGERFILIPFDSTHHSITINVNGTLDLGGKVFGYRVTQSQVGPVLINVNSGGVVKVSGTPATAELDLRDVVVTLNGTGYMDIGDWTFLYSPGNYIKTLGTGGLKRTVGATNVVFPIGLTTSYNPVTLNNSGTIDKFSVRVKSSFDVPPIDINKVVNRQWTIDEEIAGGSSVTVSLQWNASEEASGFNRNVDLNISRYTGTNWESKGAVLSGTDPYTATATNFTDFSHFIVESRPTSSFHLSTNSVAFGNVEIGTSKRESVYVKNIGASPFNITSVTSNNTRFTVEPTSATVPVGDSVKFRITFTPDVIGEHYGTITFVHTGGGSPNLLSVSGTGVASAPIFSVSPTSLNFGTIAVGRSRTDSIEVKNLGGSNLIINSIQSFSSDFSVLPTAPVTIFPGDSLMFYVKFSPIGPGTQVGNLSFYSNDPNSPHNVGLTGSALVMKTILSNGSGGGNWSSLSTWQGGELPSIVDSVVIIGSDSVYLLSDVTIGGLYIQESARLELQDTLRTIYGTIFGKIRTAGAVSSSAILASGTLRFMNGSFYIHGINGGSIPVAIWEDGSTCEVTGFISSSKPGNLNQNFYHFNWRCPNQNATVDLGWYNNTIRGNITIANPPNVRTQLTSPSAGSPNTITILGNINVLSGHFTSNGSSSSANITVNTYGNIIVTGDPNNVANTNFSISRGSGPIVSWNLYGDLIMSNATSQSSSNTPGGAIFYLAKSGIQNISLDNVTITGPVNFTVNAGSTVNLGSSVIAGSGSFIVSSGAGIMSSHPSGLNGNITCTGAGTGATPGGNSFSITANYTFNGTSPQLTGTYLPPSVNDLTISNPANVTLTSSVTVNGTASILNGDLITADKSVTLGPDAVLTETAGNTIVGIVITTRNVIQNVNNTFGGIGIEINALSASLGSTLVERITGIAQTGNGKFSILRYFNITPTNNNGLNATFVFKYDNSELNGQDANTLQLFKSVDNGVKWMTYGGTSVPAENKIILTGVSSFSRWTAADANNNIGTAPFTYNVAAGWNMVSVPLSVEDYRKVILFPNSVSNAFTFEGGYISKDILQNGLGYWLKFPSTGIVDMLGHMIFSDSVNVNTGWNMIGSISIPIHKNNIVPSAGISILSQFYGYQAGYVPTDTIKPGKAYWIKVSAPGKLYLNPNLSFGKSFGSVKELENMNSITITDANGNSQTLYFGDESFSKLPIEYFELPPSAPAGSFDVRFSSQRLVEVHPAKFDKNLSYPININEALYPITITWNLKSKSTYGYELFDGSMSIPMLNNGSTKISNENLNKILLKVNSNKYVPEEYSISKNYPNPFNPATSFEVSIPVKSNLTIRVYNLLGQEINEITSGIYEPGYYTFKWNGLSNSNETLSSGIYFYKVEAKSLEDNRTFSSVQKMVLMK